MNSIKNDCFLKSKVVKKLSMASFTCLFAILSFSFFFTSLAFADEQATGSAQEVHLTQNVQGTMTVALSDSNSDNSSSSNINNSNGTDGNNVSNFLLQRSPLQ